MSYFFMNYKPIVLGSQSSLLDYHMNSQYSNVKKLLISNDIILNSFESQDLAAFIDSQKESSPKEFTTNVESFLNSGVLEQNFQDEFYKYLQEYLTKLSDELNVELKDYSFMSSISNTKYTVVLRTSTYSFYEYYIEKGALLTSFKSLISKYLSSNLTSLQTRELDQFQIEIFESEEYQKTLFLKKEMDSLILYSTFGLFSNNVENMTLGGELYYSKGEEFNFFENTQDYAVIRQHNKIETKEIYHKEKVLGADELKQINDATKHINNALLEIGITTKGTIKILHARTNEYPLEVGSSKGIILSASSKEYDKIALIRAKNQYSQDAANPQYLLIKTRQDLDEFLRTMNEGLFDGIVLNQNLYHPFFEYLGVFYDCDVLFYPGHLEQALEVTFNRSLAQIEGFEEKKQSSASPFSSILNKEQQEKDALLDKFKNIDLSTPDTSNQVQDSSKKQVESLAESIMSSPNSSMNKKSSSSLMSFGSSSGVSGQKKSAFELLSESAFSQEKQMNQPQETPQASHEQNTQASMQETREQASSELETYPPIEEVAKEVIREDVASKQEEQMPTSMDDFFTTPNNETSPIPQSQLSQESPLVQEGIQQPSNQTSTSFDMGSVLGTPKQDEANLEEELIPEETPNTSFDISVYDSILATKVLTPTTITTSHGHIIDSSSIHELSDPTSSYIVVASEEEVANKSLNYILPRSSGYHEDAHTLINSAEDFFKVTLEDEAKGIVVNLSTISDDIKEQILHDSIMKFGVVSIIATSNDIAYLESVIESVEFVFIKDISTQEEFEEQKELLLIFEKRALMQKLR